MEEQMNEMLASFIEMDKTERVQFTLAMLNRLMRALKKVQPDKNSFVTVASILMETVWLDGEVNEAERSFLREVFVGTEQQLDETIANCKGTMTGFTERLMPILTKHRKQQVFGVCLVTACVDGVLTDEERDFLGRLSLLA